MSFGPESPNPRMRRAYAHTLVTKARAPGGSMDDLRRAHDAVLATGTSRKSRMSGLQSALQMAAVRFIDEDSQVIVDTGNRVLDPDRTERHPIMPDRNSNDQYIREGRQTSPGYVVGARGAHMQCTEIANLDTHDVVEVTSLAATDLGTGETITVPLIEGSVDVAGVVLQPESTRTALAGIARLVTPQAG